MVRDLPRLRSPEEILNDVLLERLREVRGLDSFEQALVEELTELSRFVQQSDSRTLAILAVSFLEDALKRTFIENWRISGRSDEERFFGSNGPLATFSQRSLIASSVGWLSRDSSTSVDVLRKIRNHFAHDHKVHHFATEPVVSLAASLPKVEERMANLPLYRESLAKAQLEVRLRLRVFSISIETAGEILSRSKMLRHGLAGLARPKFDDLPEVEKQIVNLLIYHAYEVLGAPIEEQYESE